MDILDKMTEISLDALWKSQVKECIQASRLYRVLVYPTKDTDYDSILYHMEEGTVSPKPQELPMPPRSWLF